MQIKLISTRKVEHLSSFWYRGPRELGNGLLGMVDGIQAIISNASPPSNVPEIVVPKACIHFLYSSGMVTCGEQTLFSALISPGRAKACWCWYCCSRHLCCSSQATGMGNTGRSLLRLAKCFQKECLTRNWHWTNVSLTLNQSRHTVITVI